MTLQPLRDGPQHTVTHLMPICVVDRLEGIKIRDQDNSGNDRNAIIQGVLDTPRPCPARPYLGKPVMLGQQQPALRLPQPPHVFPKLSARDAELTCDLCGLSVSLGRLPLCISRTLLRCSQSQPCESNENRE
nr:hypothetical protein [Promicromonospora sp. MEB111]